MENIKHGPIPFCLWSIWKVKFPKKLTPCMLSFRLFFVVGWASIATKWSSAFFQFQTSYFISFPTPKKRNLSYLRFSVPKMNFRMTAWIYLLASCRTSATFKVSTNFLSKNNVILLFFAGELSNMLRLLNHWIQKGFIKLILKFRNNIDWTISLRGAIKRWWEVSIWISWGGRTCTPPFDTLVWSNAALIFTLCTVHTKINQEIPE